MSHPQGIALHVGIDSWQEADMSSDDAVIQMLQDALAKQAEATERMTLRVAGEVRQLRVDVNTVMGTTMHKTMRMTIIMAVLCIMSIAGLVGTQIVLSRDAVTVNADPE
tara:strand:- start:1495 stop:1821 length:327 start_codon:yes stop_codon:yes gene_type:complete